MYELTFCCFEMFNKTEKYLHIIIPRVFGFKNIVHSANEALTAKGLDTCFISDVHICHLAQQCEGFFRDKP